MPLPKQHAAALAWARNHIGEHEEPPGSNTGPFVISCQRATWLPGTRWAWCTAFWIKAWREAGRKLPYLGAGTYSMLGWYRKHLPAWVVPLARARPGAAVIFNVGAGHLGMLAVPYSETNPLVETIDGNVSDRVDRRRRHASLVRGVIDPVEEGVPVRGAKPPLAEVVTSESGEAKLVFARPQTIGRWLPELLDRYGGLTIRRGRKH